MGAGRINQFKDYLDHLTSADTLTVMDCPKDSEVKIAGIASKRREITNRKGERMCFITLEDLKGVVEVIVFADIFKTCSELIQSDQPLLVTGRVSREDENDTTKVVASNIVQLNGKSVPAPSAIHIAISTGELTIQQLHDLHRTILGYPGNCGILLHLVAPGQSETILSLGDAFKVNASPHFISELKSLFGRSLRSFYS